jgi:hypothetical protein
VISPRYAAAVCVMLVLALVPTVIHVYAGAVVDDGRSAAAVPMVLNGFASEATNRPADWGRRRFESQDWTERRYLSGGDQVVLTVVRSFDLKALYHHPELAVAYGADFEPSRVQTFEPQPDVPVFVLEPRTEGPAAFYVLRYGDAFVTNPILFQIRTAGELLFTGRQAMTLFFAQQAGPSRVAGELSQQPALKVLLAAVRAFDGGASSGGQ